MAQAIPYLAFGGTCAEAMDFYARTLGLGAELTMMFRGRDAPPDAGMPENFADRVIHARIQFGDGSLLYGGDTPPDMPYDGTRGVNVTMNYPTAAEAEEVWSALVEGGKVEMPFAPAFWAKKAGMLIDRFGVAWSINGDVTM